METGYFFLDEEESFLEKEGTFDASDKTKLIDLHFSLQNDKETEADEREQINLTNVTEAEKPSSPDEEKINDKTNCDELNETSLTNKIEDDTEMKIDKFISNELPLSTHFCSLNNHKSSTDIFIIKKVKKKKKTRKNRKNDADTMRRKIKPYFHKYLLDILNQKIKKCKISPKSRRKLKLLKMNNYITSTVSIEMNKILIQRKVWKILKEEPISSKYKSFDTKNNAKLISVLQKQNDSEINSILNKTYGEMYYEYLHSEKYKSLLNKVKIKDGEKYKEKFDAVSQELICYFTMMEPKGERNKKEL